MSAMKNMKEGDLQYLNFINCLPEELLDALRNLLPLLRVLVLIGKVLAALLMVLEEK